MPAWSRPAALRAVRATLAVPGLFAFCYAVVGDLQMATFAAFGCFANLVMASFGGTRRDALTGHLGLAIVGSVLLTIGTAINGSAVVAAAVTIPVVFAVLFAGVTGPSAASGATAALLAYVLPAASPGTIAMIPSRLAGWWLAAAVSTALVLLLRSTAPGDRLREAAAGTASALADGLDAALAGVKTEEYRTAAIEAKHALLDVFTATPYRPTGLAAADQALAGVVEGLEWATSTVSDALAGPWTGGLAFVIDRRLLGAAARMLRDVARLLLGAEARPDFDELEILLTASSESVHRAAEPGLEAALHRSFHASVVAVATRTTAAQALVACRQAKPGQVAALQRRWSGVAMEPGSGHGRHPRVAEASRVMRGHASLRSVWFVNSVRGAVALAAAIAVADVTGVQHGFWVVLGALSVLRTSAASTGASALRALGGTVVGFAIGSALIIAIGSDRAALWAVLPVAVLVAAYAPGTTPFAVGQAAFTVVVAVLYNLLVPAGWSVGVVRVEDVAIGCAVSMVVGVLFWPRGVAAVVGNDLADAFALGAEYLRQAARWALGLSDAPPERASATVAAGLRVDDAMRGFLAEQGSKNVGKEDLWRLVGAALRLRLTAHSLAALHDPVYEPGRALIGQHAERLASWYADLGRRLTQRKQSSDMDGATRYTPSLEELDASMSSDVPNRHPSHLWVALHLEHLRQHLPDVAEPAAVVIERRRQPWWR